MSAWTNDELTKIGAADELQLSSSRSDGSLRKPVTIWVVRVDDDLYVRAVGGQTSPWYLGAQTRGEGFIEAGGVKKEVTFLDPGDVGDQIDAAYRAKYGHYAAQYVDPTLTPQARAATLKVVPRQ